jgi:hypothetical protein
MLRLIGVDREVISDPAATAGDRVDHRFLHPDAGMVQFGLMAGGDQRAIGRMAEIFAEELPQLRDRHALQLHIAVGQFDSVPIDFTQQSIGIRPDDDGPVLGRGFPVGVIGMIGRVLDRHD